MSMVAIPFAVDLNKVKNIFGSNDKELLQNVKSTKMYRTYSKQMEDYSYDKALQDIIISNSLNQNAGDVYGYALIAICDLLGEHLLPMCDGFYYGDNWEIAKKIAKENGVTIDLERMFEAKNVFPIPSISDFPTINYFTKEEVEKIASQMNNVEIDETKTDIDNDDFDEVQEYLWNIRNCFKTANERKVELITFMH